MWWTNEAKFIFVLFNTEKNDNSNVLELHKSQFSLKFNTHGSHVFKEHQSSCIGLQCKTP